MPKTPTPMVSVVIPFYNEHRYLENAVYSILTQTHKNLEVLVVDDSGKHAAKPITDQITDPRVKLLDYGENRGVSAARNFGLDNAKGVWVYFLDSDDFVSSRWLEKCLFAGMESGLPVCGVLNHNSEQNAALHWSGGNNDDFAIFAMKPYSGRYLTATHHQYMYSHDFLNDNKIRFAEGLVFGEDLVFYLETAHYARLCALASGEAIYYRRLLKHGEKQRPYNAQDIEKWSDTLARFEKEIARLCVLYGQKSLEHEDINALIRGMNKTIMRLSRSKWQKSWRNFLACFIPSKKLRHKFRG